MRNTLALIGMGLATILLSSTAHAQKSEDTQESKKNRHIKMMKIEDGEKVELDTVLSDDDIFVWNGDTINPPKHIKRFDSSRFGKMHWIDVENDSIRKRIIIHKRLRDGTEEDHLIHLNGSDMKHFPPMPPMPPVPPHFEMMKRAHSGRVIDLNDPNIISYEKKQISDGREKIEIIRKKSEKETKVEGESKENK